MDDYNWDKVLQEMFSDVIERKKQVLDLAFELRELIKKAAEGLKYKQLITAESIDFIEDTGAGLKIVPLELYYEPSDASRDRFMDLLVNVGDDLAFDEYQTSLSKLKNEVMERLGLLDPNNIPESIVAELKDLLFKKYNESRLGKSCVFFKYDSDLLEDIGNVRFSHSEVLAGDILIRVASQGFTGRAIHIRGNQMINLDIESLKNQFDGRRWCPPASTGRASR